MPCARPSHWGIISHNTIKGIIPHFGAARKREIERFKPSSSGKAQRVRKPPSAREVPVGAGGRTLPIARNISGCRTVLSPTRCGGSPLTEGPRGKRTFFDSLSLPPRGCARRRVSKRNRRRRLLARRLKVAPQGRMRADFPQAAVSGQRWQTLPSSARSEGQLLPRRSLFCAQIVAVLLLFLCNIDEPPALCYNTKRTNHDGTLLHRFPYRYKAEIKEAFSR